MMKPARLIVAIALLSAAKALEVVALAVAPEKPKKKKKLRLLTLDRELANKPRRLPGRLEEHSDAVIAEFYDLPVETVRALRNPARQEA